MISFILFGNDDDILKAIEEDNVALTEKKENTNKTTNNLFKPSENPDISFVMNFGAGYFTNENIITQGGHAIDNNGFALQGLEMTVDHSIDPYWKFNLNFQFVGMHVEEAYITSLALPFNIQARFGMMNALFGRENNQHLHVLNTINYSLMHSRFLSQEHFSGLATELSFLMPFPWYSMIIAQVFDTREGYFRSSSFATSNYTKKGYIDGPEDLLYLARLENFFELSDDFSLYWNFSSTFGQSAYAPDNRVTLFGSDLYLKYRPVTTGNGDFMLALTIETVLRDTQISGGFLRDYGSYAQLDMHTSKYWSFTLRGDYNDLLSGDIPTGYEDKFSKEMRGTLAISYMPTHFSRIRIQYDAVKKEGLDLYHAFFIQLEGTVGAHGAHNY
jgi:hypothetical protein